MRIISRIRRAAFEKIGNKVSPAFFAFFDVPENRGAPDKETRCLLLEALDLIRRNRDDWRVIALTANGDAEGLAKLAREFGAEVAVVADETALSALREALGGTNVQAAAGSAALCRAASRPPSVPGRARRASRPSSRTSATAACCCSTAMSAPAPVPRPAAFVAPARANTCAPNAGSGSHGRGAWRPLMRSFAHRSLPTSLSPS